MSGLQYFEQVHTTLALAVMLRDAYTGKPVLLGAVDVSVFNVETGQLKPMESTFLFENINAGAHIVHVQSVEVPPLYLPVDLAITLPMADPLWPAFPDRSLADLTLPFDSPAQSPLFRSQFVQSSLLPTVAYPFPGGATLVRGLVSSAGGPLSGASVVMDSQTRYLTDSSGEFVVWIAPYKPSVSLTFQRPGYSDSVVPVSVVGQSTTVVNVFMTL